MTLIVASLVERSISGVADSSKEAFKAGADLVEIRLDHLGSVSGKMIREARRAAQGPAIATLRSRAQGGKSDLRNSARESKLRQIVNSDFEYVDLELGTDDRLMSEVRAEEIRPAIIASWHFAKPVSRGKIKRKLLSACRAGDIGKVAMQCEHAGHATMLAQVGVSMARLRKRFVLIGMGAQGQMTRACADRIGSELVYTCLPGKEAAPGQFDVVTQQGLITRDRLVLGLLGHPVSHSVSKPMQEAALEHAGIKGVYLPLDFPQNELDKRALRTMRALGFTGINVTIPHKAWAYDVSTKKGPAAAATGAVNTLLIRPRSVVGENTDVVGFSRLLDGKITITRHTKSLIIGAGGAARAVAYVLSERGTRIKVTDVEMKKARALARDFRCHAVKPGSLYRLKEDFALIVNCTPVGMKGVSDKSPVKDYLFKPGRVFIDIIFNPAETTAMRNARSRGAIAYGGLEMLVQQGAESFRIWTGKEPNTDAMREAARRALT